MSDYVIPRPDTLVREGRAAAGDHAIDRRFCQVVGRNRNHQSANGTQYHIQIEDLGPMVDHATRLQVRRVNLVVYANYGESNARIVYSRNYDLPDIRTAA